MDHHYAGNPNIAQIGINDTPLTLALETGDFKTAEKFIEENTDATLLDEGPFEKIPLAMVLSSEPTFRQFPRHLRLAKLLVEGGGNPNLRIPHAEWQGATASPMEYLVDLLKLTNILCRNGSEDVYAKYELINPLFTIGLHDETELTPLQLREQLLELLDLFLAFGGNPNVTTVTANSTVFQVALSHTEPDMDVVMKLCDAGGDINQSNVHGTTPLMDLITYAEGDAAFDILQQIWSRNPDISSLQAQNCAKETALWRAMFAGSPRLAIELMNRGADPCPRAMDMVGKSRLGFSNHGNLKLNMQIVLTGVPAILAPLLQDSSPYIHLSAAYTGELTQQDAPPPFSVALLNKVFSSAISPVVDYLPLTRVFPDPVLGDLNMVIFGQTNFVFDNSDNLEVAALMFGKLKAGLQQMCVKQILHQAFFAKNPYEALLLVGELSNRKVISERKKDTMEEDKKSSTPDKGEKLIVVDNMNGVSEWEVIRAINEATIKNLVRQRLQLPPVFVQKFQVETARLQVGSAVYPFESVDCMVGCDNQSEEGSSQLTDDFDDDDDDAEDDESDWLPDFMSSDEFDLTEWDEEEEEDNDDEDEDEEIEEGGDMDEENVDADSNDTDGVEVLEIDCPISPVLSDGMDVDSGSEHSAGNDKEDDLIMCIENSSTSDGLEWEDIDREQYETLEDLGCDDSST